MNYNNFAMGDPNIRFEGNMVPTLENVGIPPGGPEQNQFVPLVNMPSASTGVSNNMPPPIPPRVDPNYGLGQQAMVPNYSYGGMGSYGTIGMGSYGMGGYGGYGGYSGGYGGYGMGGMGAMGGMGGMYGGYNRYGLGAPNYGDIESR